MMSKSSNLMKKLGSGDMAGVQEQLGGMGPDLQRLAREMMDLFGKNAGAVSEVVPLCRKGQYAVVWERAVV